MSTETELLQNLEESENDYVDDLARKIRRSNARIIWNMGVGDGSGLLGFQLHMSEKAVCKLTDFDHVIRISIPSISDGYSSNESNEGIDEIRKKAVMAIANELGIMDEDNTPLINLKNQLEEQTYYTYIVDKEKESKLVEQMENLIFQKLESKRYLLIVQNMDQSLFDPKNRWLLESLVPLPVMKSKSYWVISTTSIDVCNRSISETKLFLTHHIFELSKLISNSPYWYPLSRIIELELFHVAKSISTNVSRNLTRTMDVLWNSLLYSQLFSTELAKSREEESCPYYIQQKELVKFWISEGIFNQTAKLARPRNSHIRFLGMLVADEEVMDGGNGEEEDYPNPGPSWLGDEETILRILLSHSLLRNINSSPSYPISSSDAPVVPFSGMWELLARWKEQIRLFSNVEKNSWLRNPWALIEPNSYEEWTNKNWISFFNGTGRWIIHPKPNPTTTFVLRGCTDMSKLSLEMLFPRMKHLRVLDLSYTSIELLPLSLSEMTDLRLLSLRGCNLLRTLVPHSSSDSASSPLGPLERIEFLDFRGVSLDTIPDDVGNFKYELRYLDLSSPTITSLPSNFFQHMSNLRELFFLGCAKLGTLPLSLANLLNLEMFTLSESQLVYLPNETFERMSKLQALKLINNQFLRTLPKLAGHATLKSLTLSGSPITGLSLYACRSLETVCLQGLEQLEELDLSATAIKEFPIEVSELRRLRRLDLLAVPHLKRVPWHKWGRLPEVFNLDQCDYEFVGNHGIIVQSSVAERSQLFKGGVGARIFLTDSRLFSSFTYEDCKHLVEEGGSLQSFHISISSWKVKERREKGNERTHPDQFHKKQASCYKDVSLIESTFKQQFEQSPLNRHVEISSAERYPAGLEGILQIAESLSVADDDFVSSLTDLNPQFSKLQECKLRQCHLMEAIFRDTGYHKGEKLQTLWVSDLPKMTKVIAGAFWPNEFTGLKHVHIQHCHRLESVFLAYMPLKSLETITVLYCGNLTTVFRHKIEFEDQFPKLHTIQLHELPQLLHLCEKQKTPLQMQEWKELHIRGCWNFRQLPLLAGPRDQKVCVDGEARQCKKLKAGMSKDQLSCYDFKSPPPSASFREGVKNNIFLR